MQHPVTVPRGAFLLPAPAFFLPDTMFFRQSSMGVSLPAPAFFLPDTMLQNFFDFFVDKGVCFA